MDALYHSPSTETSLSNPFRGHARLSVIARCAKVSLTDGRLRVDGCLLSHPEFVDGRQPHTCAPDMARAISSPSYPIACPQPMKVQTRL